MSRYPTQTNCYLQYLPAWEVVVLLFEFLPGTNIMSIILNIKRDELPYLRTLTVLRGGRLQSPFFNWLNKPLSALTWATPRSWGFQVQCQVNFNNNFSTIGWQVC